MATPVTQPTPDNGAAPTPTAQDDRTAFEKQYAELKQAKLDARTKQSEVSKMGDLIVEMQKQAKVADEEHKRALKKVDALKEGLSELFASEMRNY